MIASKHKRFSKETNELYRTESAWGEVDNCWGQLGYVNILMYKPPAYSDIKPNSKRVYKKYRAAKYLFRTERNADIYVRTDPFGDLLAVALRKAALPYNSTSS
jgi:hypothetical protein